MLKGRNDKRGDFLRRARKQAKARAANIDERPAHLYTVWDPRICPDFIDALLGVLSEYVTVKLPVIADTHAKVIQIELPPNINRKINKQVSETETVLIVQCLNIFDNNALYAGKVNRIETIDDKVGDIDDILMPQMTINNNNDLLITSLISLSELIPISLDVLNQFCIVKSEALFNQIYFSYPMIIRKRSEKFKLFEKHVPSPFKTISITRTNKSSDKAPRYSLTQPPITKSRKKLSIGPREVLLLRAINEKGKESTINAVANKMNKIAARFGFSGDYKKIFTRLSELLTTNLRNILGRN